MRSGGYAGQVFVFSRRSGRRTELRFFPGCLIWSIVISIVLTVLLNVILRAF